MLVIKQFRLGKILLFKVRRTFISFLHWDTCFGHLGSEFFSKNPGGGPQKFFLKIVSRMGGRGNSKHFQRWPTRGFEKIEGGPKEILPLTYAHFANRPKRGLSPPSPYGFFSEGGPGFKGKKGHGQRSLRPGPEN